MSRQDGREQASVAAELLRRADGRWVNSTRHVDEAVAPEPTPPVDGVPNPATTELAVTRARADQAGADWDELNQYDPAFEAASSRFFETDPGNRLTYEHLLDDGVGEPDVAGYQDPAGYRDPAEYRGPTGYGDPGEYQDPAGYRDPGYGDVADRGREPEFDATYPGGHYDDRQRQNRYADDPTTDVAHPYHDPVDGDDPVVDEDELATGAAARRNAIEWAVVLVAAVLLALVLRALVLQAFYIPSPSMEDTLLIQDRVLVNKLSYRFGDIGRGDIVVFHRTDEEIASAGPSQPKDVIKRVIALGGETIEIRESTVYIDGDTLQEPYLEPGLLMPDFGPLTVPEGFLFVMGDNRNLSSDSRGELGPIAEDRVVGRAFVLFWPVNRVSRL